VALTWGFASNEAITSTHSPAVRIAGALIYKPRMGPDESFANRTSSTSSDATGVEGPGGRYHPVLLVGGVVPPPPGPSSSEAPLWLSPAFHPELTPDLRWHQYVRLPRSSFVTCVLTPNDVHPRKFLAMVDLLQDKQSRVRCHSTSVRIQRRGMGRGSVPPRYLNTHTQIGASQRSGGGGGAHTHHSRSCSPSYSIQSLPSCRAS
jgi:hypothetical protein